jgi:signal transduction histidine kinase
MTLIFRINLLMLTTFILGTGACLWHLRSAAPPLNWAIEASFYLLFSGYSGLQLLLFRLGKISSKALLGDQLLLSNRVVWLANAPIIGGLWLLFPYVTNNLLLVYVVLSMTATSGFMLSTIVRPPARRFVWLSPSLIALSNALFFIVHPHEFSFILAPINIVFCAASLLAKWQLQEVMHDAYLAQREAEAARGEAETQRDAKTRFLASASHDLGQPLQAARMFFDQALRYEAGEKREKAVRGVHLAFDTTEHLLGQMMAHLQLESGVVESRLEALVIGPLIAEVADMNEPAAVLAGVSLHAMPCGLTVLADPALVERALGNLIGNAIRHAKAKRILIGARTAPSPPPPGGREKRMIRIWVIDDGVGIPLADLPRLFDDYVQGSDHGQEIRGGFGLGLATTRRLARLMGGDAGYEAKWVKGSAFWLELPAA